MIGRKVSDLALLGVAAFLLISCGGHDPGSAKPRPMTMSADDKVLNLLWWSDFLAPETIANFEKQTGIKIRATYFDTNETLESRLLTGHSGFDVVDPTATFFQRQIRSGVYMPLDRTRLPNWKNLNPVIMSKVALNDPGNANGIVYAWGTYGIAYNKKQIAAALPGVPSDSWRMLFDPTMASKLAKCGIGTLDSPTAVVRIVLAYLGRAPNSPTAQDLLDVESTLAKIRPFVRNIDSSSLIGSLANGDICIAFESNGDAVQARNRATESKNGVEIGFVLPKEGSMLWFDMVGIPRDAPNVENAHRFLNYLMDPQVAADFTNFTGFANANSKATSLLHSSIAVDPMIYPTAEDQKRLFAPSEDSPEQARAITRLWQKFKTGL